MLLPMSTKPTPAEFWTHIDHYLEAHYTSPDPVLEHALRMSEEAGLPPIAVSAVQGKLLALLVQMLGAHKVLELGTLGGYSSICMGRALPSDGKLITLEYDPKHAAVARANIAFADLVKVVEVRVGAALETLPQLLAEGCGPFDLVFMDATKEEYPEYFDWAMKLSHSGTVIVADNVVRGGEVANDATENAMARGARRFHDKVAADPRVTATAIQTVGTKGHDGFALIRVK
jgi:predicted O-methyltransferase YrrM